MKSLLKKIFSFIFLSFISGQILLAGVTSPNAERIGIYIGSFDPPHAGHRAMVLRSLESGAVNRVLVVPNDLTPHKPFRSRTEDRLQMLRIMFRENPQVIVPDLQWGFPILQSSLRQLQNQVAEESLRQGGIAQSFERVFIAGDDVYESRVHAWLTELSISPSEWIIFPRHHETPSETEFRGRPVHFIPRSEFEKSLSSSRLRTRIQTGGISSQEMTAAFGGELAWWILERGIYSEDRSKLQSCKSGLASLRIRLSRPRSQTQPQTNLNY